MYGAPLSVMWEVVRTKSVEFMPLPLSAMSFLNSAVWSLYGFYVQDSYIAMPNNLGTVLTVAQVRWRPKGFFFKLPLESVAWSCALRHYPVPYLFNLHALVLNPFARRVAVGALHIVPPWWALKWDVQQACEFRFRWNWRPTSAAKFIDTENFLMCFVGWDVRITARLKRALLSIKVCHAAS